MKTYLLLQGRILVTFILLFCFAGFSAMTQTEGKATIGGELSFTVRTVTANGNYAPRNILAIWVEDTDGFVKSRKVMANARKQYLYTWVSASNYNVVDATTGPTLSNHQTHTVLWDCTDLDGNIVPDGDYVVWAEFTEQHAQGPLYSLTFTKGSEFVSISPADETYFKDIALTFSPVVCDFSADATEVCQSSTLVFTDESINAISWEWDFGTNAYPPTANTQGPHTVAFAYPGTSTISLTVNGNITETKENYIQVNTSPMADFMFSGSDLTVNFTNTSLNALTYSWDFGDGNISTIEDPTHTYLVAGSYLVTLTAINGNCDEDVTFEVNVPMVGIEENNFAASIRIFPNPNHGTVFIETGMIREIHEIKVIDVTGQLIKTIRPSASEDALLKVDLGEVKTGIYFLEIIADNDVAVKRIVVR
jgi:PKD repeat protein